jgi:hypothetical protein
MLEIAERTSVKSDSLQVLLVLSGYQEDLASAVFPSYRDRNTQVALALGITQTPAAVVIRTDGRLEVGPVFGSRAVGTLLRSSVPYDVGRQTA